MFTLINNAVVFFNEKFNFICFINIKCIKIFINY